MLLPAPCDAPRGAIAPPFFPLSLFPRRGRFHKALLSPCPAGRSRRFPGLFCAVAAVAPADHSATVGGVLPTVYRPSAFVFPIEEKLTLLYTADTLHRPCWVSANFSCRMRREEAPARAGLCGHVTPSRDTSLVGRPLVCPSPQSSARTGPRFLLDSLSPAMVGYNSAHAASQDMDAVSGPIDWWQKLSQG